MRKLIAAGAVTTALVGIPAAHVAATSPPDTVEAATAAVAEDEDDGDDGDNTGLWGLLGLLGLVGLAGLRGRRDRYVPTTSGVTAAPPTAYGATSEPDLGP